MKTVLIYSQNDNYINHINEQNITKGGYFPNVLFINVNTRQVFYTPEIRWESSANTSILFAPVLLCLIQFSHLHGLWCQQPQQFCVNVIFKKYNITDHLKTEATSSENINTTGI